MDEVAREEEGRSRRENRPRLPVKMVFETRASDDRRRYNVATSNEIAVVYKGDDEHMEGERRLVIMERSGRLSFIKDYDPMCDPLTYPILFPRGEMGHDRARIRIHQNSNGREPPTPDEIRAHLDARYVYAPEAMYRIFEFPLQGRSDHVERLPVHLEHQHTDPFFAGQEEDAIITNEDTKLTAWFALNREFAQRERQNSTSSAETDPRQLCYHQVSEYYTWDDNVRKWKPRKQRSRIIGRMHFGNPKETERFAMRLILLYRKGAASFVDLRTVDRVYDTYVEAAKAAGYMNDDSFYESSMREAAGFRMPSELRSFFASLICFCELSNPRSLWELYKTALSEDFRNQGMRSEHAESCIHLKCIKHEDAESLAFHEISAKTALHSVVLSSVLQVEYAMVDSTPNDDDYLVHRQLGDENYLKLNLQQKIAVDAVLSATQDNGSKLLTDQVVPAKPSSTTPFIAC
ncbi:hypothetical protein OESDEN_04724 [Oesophagostomum dentatum]|uniref:Helitron helicase-like domain-containing protein n=1 Tax=Oesophagostomum dentatum TaxID=61180 RepID=A0A0B1TIT6_OESDE|nr:hypothetical protein OESDEN_04724 [Oesophagostomum dentatum]